MTLLLILFFGSLLGMAGMIGRKIFILEGQDHRHVKLNGLEFEIPHLEEITKDSIKGLQKYGYSALVVTLKMYVKSSNILKQQYEGIKNKIKTARTKNMSAEEVQAAETKVSKFLEMISDYKHKIRKIKHQITEEEKNL